MAISQLREMPGLVCIYDTQQSCRALALKLAADAASHDGHFDQTVDRAKVYLDFLLGGDDIKPDDKPRGFVD
jgi:hypothetical protein